MQYIPLLAGVEQGIVDCFRTGGGLSYDHFPRFHALMAEDSAAVFDAALVDVVLPLVEGLPDRLRDGIHVADIGCGSGHAVNVLAQAYPASRLVGYDFSTEAIQAARVEADKLGLTNARFEVIDVATLDQPESFDLVTAFDAIHDQAHPTQVLAAVARAVRPDGVFMMVDLKASSNLADNLELPWAPFLYTVSTLHCMTVSLGLDEDGLGTALGAPAGHRDALRCRLHPRRDPRGRGRPVQQLLPVPHVRPQQSCRRACTPQITDEPTFLSSAQPRISAAR
jgi:SAM-dependent methyltransferase